MQLLADGLGFPESVRWHDGRVWLCDWGSGRVLALEPGGAPEVMAQLPADTLPLSIDWTREGELLVVDGPRRRVLREGEVLEEIPGEGPLNEMTVASDGAAYVNGGDRVFRLGDGPVLDDLLWPNGMAVVDRTLVVADSHRSQLVGLDLDTGARRVWADVEFAPDGICADASGAVWYAPVPGRACIRVAEGGEVLDTVALDRGGFSCALGDDGTLFIGAAAYRGMEHLQQNGPGITGRLLAMPGVGFEPTLSGT